MNSQNRRAFDPHRQRRHRDRAIAHTFTRTLLLRSLLIAASALGCSSAEEWGESEEQLGTEEWTESEEQLGTHSEGLSAKAQSGALWGSTVNVCFRRVPIPATQSTPLVAAPSQAVGDAAIAIIMDAWQTGWQASAALTFVTNGDCPGSFTNDVFVPGAAAQNWLKILLNDGSNIGVCNSGLGAKCTFSATSDENGLRFMALHEVGHALGMGHEHQRDDVAACAGVQRDVTIYQAVVDHTPAPGCTCVAGNPSLPNDLLCVAKCWMDGQPDAVRVDAANYGLSQNAPDSSMVRLTIPAPGTSVMDYCTISPFPPPFGQRPALLSDLDRLGIEMMYPRNFSRRISTNGGFSNTAGSRSVVRSGQTVGLSNDWVDRGAIPIAFSNIVWSAPSAFSTSLTTTMSTSTSKTISLSLKDVKERIHSSSILVEVNNALHTAILSTATML